MRSKLNFVAIYTVILFFCSIAIVHAQQPIELPTNEIAKLKFVNFENFFDVNGNDIIDAGDYFEGIINVESITNISSSVDLSAQLNTKELTGHFKIHVIGGFLPLVLPLGTSGHVDLGLLSGDFINVYVGEGATKNWDPAAADAIARACDGMLWASTVGNTGFGYEGINDTTTSPVPMSVNRNWLDLDVNNTGYTIVKQLYSTSVAEPPFHFIDLNNNGVFNLGIDAAHFDHLVEVYFASRLFDNIDPNIPNWDFRSEDPLYLWVEKGLPCIDIEKEISIDDGTTWLDADTVDTAAKATAPHGAMYRLIVRNCGNVDLIDVVINDPTLGITDYPVGNLAVGEEKILTSVQIPELNQPNRCETPGEYKNTATVSGKDANGTTVTDSDPAYLICTPPPCIDIEKEISIDDGTTWLDADTVDTAAKATAPHGAMYRLIVRNCGNVDLFNVVISDPTLGITDYPVGNLAGGEEKILTSAEIPALDQPNRCETPGEYKNTATVSGTDTNGTTVTDSDPAWLACEQKPLACRVTAGGNKDNPTLYCPLLPNGLPDKDYCNNDIYDTWGGQAGAQPRIDGNWTHHYHPGKQKAFVFHSNNLFWVTCSDPGCCVPACANAKNRQIDFAGIGKFNNQKGFTLPTVDLCFTVHLEDIGEPGPGGRWPKAPGPCTHCPETPIDNSDCVNCTDYYEIKIYNSADHDNAGHCTGQLLYKNGSISTNCGLGDPMLEGYFTRTGNVQMHPDNNGP